MYSFDILTLLYKNLIFPFILTYGYVLCFRSYNGLLSLTYQISILMLPKIDSMLGNHSSVYKFLIIFAFRSFSLSSWNLSTYLHVCTLQVLANRKKISVTLKLIILRGSTTFTRRSCQTVLAEHLLSIVKVIAPILPHLAEDVWQNLPFPSAEDGSIAKFVFESKWPALNEKWLSFPNEEIDFWGKILEVITVQLKHWQANL